jgi:lipopolysaccharide biosynthesis regulator YciM
LAGEYEQAERAAAKGLESPSASPYSAYVHAAALVKLNSKDTDRILHELDVADRGIPKCSLCRLVRSKVHQEAGNPEAAIADLEPVVNGIAPDLPMAWYRLAALYRKVGRDADAEAALRKFRGIKTTDADVDADLFRRALLPPKSR